MDFDAVGDVTNVVVHWVVDNGVFADHERYECISSATCPFTESTDRVNRQEPS